MIPEVSCSHAHTRELIWFGSYVRGDQSDTSDIDILVDFDPALENFDNYLAVCDILERVFKNERIEIVTKNGLSPYIGPKILKEVQYVQNTDGLSATHSG